MNILMVTNMFTPKLSGVSQSVVQFTEQYRKKGHQVWTVAPAATGAPDDENQVIRVPSVNDLADSDFSFAIPPPHYIINELADFVPDVIHSHHPFSLGPSGMRLASYFQIPLVYTYHTMYEDYAHYFSLDNEPVRNFIVRLAAEYADLCDAVVAPSRSVKEMLEEREVTSRIEVIPTGVDIDKFSNGDGRKYRSENEIPEDVLVIGHVGRLEPEKNMDFLARSVMSYMESNTDVHFLLVGVGSSRDEIVAMFEDRGLSNRLHIAGRLDGRDLIDAYHAMDIFAFASKTETQGMVMTEAMASGAAVVALQASGARDVIDHEENGLLVDEESEEQFAEALKHAVQMLSSSPDAVKASCKEKAQSLSLANCADKALNLYQELIQSEHCVESEKRDIWEKSQDRLKVEWDLIKAKTSSFVEAINMTVNTTEEPGE